MSDKNKPDFEKVDEVERRTHSVELRTKGATYGKRTPSIEGYAANFNSLSEDLGGFREMLVPGCFADAIKTSDIRCLYNHDPNLVLGRNVSGTLRITEDEVGLRFEADLPETTYAKDLQVSMTRGDISNCSFGFRVAEDGDAWRKEPDGSYLRSILKVDRLFDVSPVTYPAYAATSCAVRSLDHYKHDTEAEEARATAEAVEEQRKMEMESAELELKLIELEL
jgi:HK97 family phage prohead protease